MRTRKSSNSTMAPVSPETRGPAITIVARALDQFREAHAAWLNRLPPTNPL
jgi:hypothetical protein